MGKWDSRKTHKPIAEQHIKGKSTDNLHKAKAFLENLLELRKVTKLQKTYVQGVQKCITYNRDDRVHPEFKLEGTTSGRLSCAGYKAGSKGPKGVSFHTLPRKDEELGTIDIRSSFVAPKGWVFLQADYSAMELRILSHIAKEHNMRKAFREGLDLHTYSAQLTFKQDQITKLQRQLATVTSFLIVYGGGAFNLANTFGISQPEAQPIIDAYFEAFPGIPEFMRFVENHIKEHGYAYTIFGRRRHLDDVYSPDPKIVSGAVRSGINFTIQSSASDVLLISLTSIAKEFRARKLKAYAVATVHDSIEIVAPPEEVAEVLSIMRYHMVEYPAIKEVFGIEFEVPLAIDAEIGPSFGNAKHVAFDEQGSPILTEEQINEAIYLG